MTITVSPGAVNVVRWGATQAPVALGDVGMNVVTGYVEAFIAGAVRELAALAPAALTSGSVLFANASGLLEQNNANFFWDAINGRLGLGTNAPSVRLEVSGALTLVDALGTAAFIEQATGVSAAVAPANRGRIRYNATTQTWQLSANTGAFADIGTTTPSGWTDDGTIVRLTTATDTVAIGAAVMSGGGEQLRVVGISRFEDNVLLVGASADLEIREVAAAAGSDSNKILLTSVVVGALSRTFSVWNDVPSALVDTTALRVDDAFGNTVLKLETSAEAPQWVGQFLANGGTAAHPTWSYIDDPDSGVHLSAVGAIDIVIGASSRFRVTNTTVSTFSADLSVGGAASMTNATITGNAAITGEVRTAASTPASMATTENDYAGATGAFARLSPNVANTIITGFAGGADGRRLTLVNLGAGTVTINNQDAGSLVGNRVITATGAAVVMVADDMLEMIYDATTARWRQITGVA